MSTRLARYTVEYFPCPSIASTCVAAHVKSPHVSPPQLTRSGTGMPSPLLNVPGSLCLLYNPAHTLTSSVASHKGSLRLVNYPSGPHPKPDLAQCAPCIAPATISADAWLPWGLRPGRQNRSSRRGSTRGETGVCPSVTRSNVTDG